MTAIDLTEKDHGPLLELHAGNLHVALAPRMGGSVLSFCRHEGPRVIELLRTLPGKASGRSHITKAAMFPMLPHANRIANNRFNFEGHTYRVRSNVENEKFNLHGSGWSSAWMPIATNQTFAELMLEHEIPNEPYSYVAHQLFSLTANHLRVEIRLTNRGARAMPFGFGLHPWWPRTSDVELRFRAASFWLEGPDHLATVAVSIPRDLDFSQRRPLLSTWRNNCYSGWDGVAEVFFTDSPLGLRLEADPIYRHLVLYCDPKRTDFCLEPQTHAIGALNRLDAPNPVDGDPLILRPGESATGAVSFTVLEREALQ